MSDRPKLYALGHSHPAMAARLMLEHKGIEAQVWNIFPGVHPVVVRAAGFPGRTVPALRIDGRRVQGSRAIARRLDELQPEPALLPADPALRAAVVDAERWGHDDLQALARRVFRFAALRSHAIRAWMAAEVAGVPFPRLAGRLMKPAAAYFARVSGATGEAVRQDLRRLPALLERADALIADGTIAGSRRNAADFQILCSVGVLHSLTDLRPVVESHRCGQAALRLVPRSAGPVPRGLPPEWLPRAGAAAHADGLGERGLVASGAALDPSAVQAHAPGAIGRSPR